MNDVKTRIIDVTTKLIQENRGDISKITSRTIAREAGIGLGLINYHFGSKDNLITVCVQRIIKDIVRCFSPAQTDYKKEDGKSDRERLTDWAKQVCDFLYTNEAIAKISILGDMQNYMKDCNAAYTQKGFYMAIRETILDEKKKSLVFMLASSLQVALLMGEESKEILGSDWTDKEQRDQYIDGMTELLFQGIENKGGK